MVERPLGDQTLDEACANGDGSYDGVKLAQWLFAVITGKETLTREEVEKMWEEAKRKRDT